MRLGQVDMGTISAANLGAFGRAVDFLTLPYLFENQMAALPAIEGWLNDEINKLTHSQMGVHIWGWVPVCGQRQLLQDVRLVKVPGDLKGIKLVSRKAPLNSRSSRTGAQWRSPTTGRPSIRAFSPGS